MMNIKPGSTFGALTVIGPSRFQKRCREFLCRCACGCEKWFRSDKLPKRKSCGCIRRARGQELRAETELRRAKRAALPPPIPRKPRAPKKPPIPPEFRAVYGIYRGMLRRCSAKSGRLSRFYREKGVSVCPSWRDSFTRFAVDMGPRPSKAYSIDRYPDPTGNYEPSNCRWATMREQQRNRRNCIKIAFCGEQMTAGEIAEITGVSRSVVFRMLQRALGLKRNNKPRSQPRGLMRGKKLSAPQVREILERHRAGELLRVIAERFSLSTYSVLRVVRGETRIAREIKAEASL